MKNQTLIQQTEAAIAEVRGREDVLPNERNAASCLSSAVNLLKEADAERQVKPAPAKAAAKGA